MHCKQPAALHSYLLRFIGHTFTGKTCGSLLAPGLAEGETVLSKPTPLPQRWELALLTFDLLIQWRAVIPVLTFQCIYFPASSILILPFASALLGLFILGNIICIVNTPGFVNSSADRISFHGPGNGVL